MAINVLVNILNALFWVITQRVVVILCSVDRASWYDPCK